MTQATYARNYTRQKAVKSSPQGTYVPPHNLDAEQSTLGAMLIERPAVERARETLSCGDFYRPEHQLWFSAICAASDRGEATDFVTLKAEMNRHGDYEHAGGDRYLVALLDAVPSAASVAHYAGIVKREAIKRQIFEAAQELQGLALHAGNEPDTLLVRAQSLLDGIAGRVDADRQTDRIIDMADAWAMEAEEESRIFGDFLVPGCQTVISSPGGLGKTTLVYNLISHLAEGRELWGIPVIRSYKVRDLDMETPPRVRRQKLKNLYLEQPPIQRMADFVGEVKDYGKYLRECKRDGVELAIFDTASRCFPRVDENSNSEVYERVIPILDGFKREGIATLVVTHTGKGGTGVRGASAFADAVDIALSLELHEGRSNEPDATLALKTLKNRIYGFTPPLYLQRDGFDRFRRVEGTIRPDEADATPTARVRCAGDVIAILEGQTMGLKFTEIVKRMTANGHAEGTAKKVICELQKQGQISHNGTGYVIEAGSDD